MGAKYVSGVLDRPFAQQKQVGKGALGVSQTHHRYGKERAERSTV
jgi:hypothetical protein